MAEQVMGQYPAAMPHHLLRLSQAGVILSIHQGHHALIFDEVIGQPLADWLTPTSAKKLSKFLKAAARQSGPSILELEALQGNLWKLTIQKRISDNDSLDFLCGLTDRVANVQSYELVQRLGELETSSLMTDQIAHDMNNKLTILLGTLSLLNVKDVDPEAFHDHLSTMIEATTNAKELLSHLQKELRKDTGPRTVNLTEIIQHLAESFQRKNFKIATDLPPEQILFSGNGTQIIIALSNLILNALEADSTDPLTIRMERIVVDDDSPYGVANGPAAVIHITDNGPGIKNQQMASIFQPFFSTKEGAPGLGLPLARTAIKKHDGELHLLQNGQHGCTFQIVIPIIDATPLPDIHQVEPVISATPEIPSLRFLLLDDDQFILEVTTEMLVILGHSAISAADCDQAVQLYKDEIAAGRRIDLAMLDLVIANGPGGAEVLHELRAVDPSLQAIASSGQSTNPVMLDPTAHGFLAALPKPYGVSDLSQVIANAIK
ncbi:hypothetical protein BVY04_03600 [bacterium M21]|nr:hypothetical protein BVY04_03600 [bacterium M21]